MSSSEQSTALSVGSGEAGEAQREVRYEYTPLLADQLQQLRVTLLVSTYQAGFQRP